ncbi:MAG TPA: antitoxin [Sulfurovum sp.]|nr:antitoxin [Sulfurovum sp.]
MKDINYTAEELELVEYMETDPNSIPNVEDEIVKITNIFKENRESRKQINFRLLESDLDRLKTRALVDGVPYQTLLSSIVHKFLNGTLVNKV